jgi:hypothetical protein
VEHLSDLWALRISSSDMAGFRNKKSLTNQVDMQKSSSRSQSSPLRPTAATLVGSVLASIFLLAGTGCHLGKPASASFASVVIPGKSPEEIGKATVAVFQEAGYSVTSTSLDNLIFQKEGTRGQNLAYGGVVDSYYGSTTKVRVKAQIVDLGEGSNRLQCQAYIVRDAGDSFFEEEQKMASMRSGPYQSLLNKVVKRLEGA